ncbi:MAG: DUF2752 domain-containing protein [Bacteroidales bacterium]|nr:DUF2752 domain-containing protein [Bacteroidales bacterium]
MAKYKKYLLITVAIFIIATALFILFYIDPNVYPFFPKCPFLVATGLECPGCGSQRAMHQLLHLNIAGAFRQNPLIVLYLPYVVLGIYLEYFGGNKRLPRVRNTLYGKSAAIIILISIVLFWIGRNIF